MSNHIFLPDRDEMGCDGGQIAIGYLGLFPLFNHQIWLLIKQIFKETFVGRGNRINTS